MPSITRSASPRITTFKFTSLPTEIRLMVWEETFEPRILHIVGETIVLPPAIVPQTPRIRGCCRGFSFVHVRFKSREKPPMALQICTESRTLALKHYTPSFQSRTYPPSRAAEMKQTAVYFDPTRDIVYIVDHAIGVYRLLQHSNEGTIRRIKVLAMGGCHAGESLRGFEGLKRLIIVVGGEAGREEEESIRENMEEVLIKARDRLVLQGNVKEWKLPTVKVMGALAFESLL